MSGLRVRFGFLVALSLLTTACLFEKMVRADEPSIDFPGWVKDIDAALLSPFEDGKVFFFKGTRYIKYDKSTETVDHGYPLDIHEPWQLPESVTKIDAVIPFKNRLYFFVGKEYYCYDISPYKLLPNYPYEIEDTWKGVKIDGDCIDDVVDIGDNNIYFFDADKYTSYSKKEDKAMNNNRTTDKWPGVTARTVDLNFRIDTALNYGNGKLWFFSGDQCMRYDIASDKADTKWTKISDTWPFKRTGKSEYTVEIFTTDQADAGTDAGIYMSLVGHKGTSNEFYLNPLADGNAFERGDTNAFDFSSKINGDLGIIEEVKIRVAGNGLAGGDWHLNKIVVKSRVPTTINQVNSTFRFNKWITVNSDATAKRDEGPLLQQIGTEKIEGDKELDQIRLYDVQIYDSFASSEPQNHEIQKAINLENSTMLEKSESDSLSIEAGAELGLKNTFGGGQQFAKSEVELKLSFKSITENTRSLTESIGSSKGTSETVTRSIRLAPGKIQIDIQSASVDMIQRKVKSILADDEFLVTFVQNINGLSYQSVTFPIGAKEANPTAEDLMQLSEYWWNMIVARPLAVSKGKGEYDKLVESFIDYGIMREDRVLSFSTANDKDEYQDVKVAKLGDRNWFLGFERPKLTIAKTIRNEELIQTKK